MAKRFLVASSKCFTPLFNGSCSRYASSFDSPKPNFDIDGNNEQSRLPRFGTRPLGDQRTHFVQRQRMQRNIRGETQFNPQFRPGNVSGFGGRGGFGQRESEPLPEYSDRFGAAGASLRPINWSNVNLPPIVKNFYEKQHEVITQRSQAEIDSWLKSNHCTLKGNNIPRPVFNFTETGFPDPIVEYLRQTFDKPTPIQSITWPVALSGKDLISIAMTGSGKTLGFVLPAIVHIFGQQNQRQRGDGPSMLVLCPTRELAIQVESVARIYCELMDLKITCCYGGAAKSVQGRALRDGVDICVATPGRILDFLEMGVTNMHRCSYLVVDEADRMLDMGFEPQIRSVVGQIRPDRQTLMFSATWPQDVRSLASDFLTDPLHLTVGSLDLAANHNIQQHVEVIDGYNKEERFYALLDEIMQQPECKTLVFASTKRAVDWLTTNLRRAGKPAHCIHGNKSQSEREWVLNEFRTGKTPILVATEVAARGLDVDNIKYVINFDYPNDAEDYVHRIGRTGRQNKKGTSYTFFTQEDAPKARGLIAILEEAKQNVPAKLRQLCVGRNGRN